MKAPNDEYLQKLIEEGRSLSDAKLSAADQQDFEAYEDLFQALKEEPSAELSYQFSAKVRMELQAIQEKKNNYKFYISVVLIVLVCLGSTGLVMALIDDKYATNFLTSVFAYKWAIAFGLLCLLLIQHFDQKLVKKLDFK